ncbi:MAG: glycoside hydrolase family 88 protein [Clostridia bacterium]|nr:glycoside hydrolase family 88 protein [Clostridia bacterium]
MSIYQEIAHRVMDRLLSVRGDGDLHDHLTLDTWEWPQGVALYAMMKVYLAGKEPALKRQIAAWYDRRLALGLPSRNINTTAPMLGLAFLYEITREKKYRGVIAEWAEWIMNGLPRTEEGGFQHVTSDDFNAQQIWDDTLFMTVLFLYRAGEALGRQDWQEEAKYQFLLHIKYLHSQKDHLWYHGYCFRGGHHFAGAYWCRGNSWFTAGGADFLEWLEEGSVKTLIRNTFVSQCEALKACQDPQSGLWHTLLDDPESYLETSGSAAIAYGLLKGVRLGILPRAEYGPCARRAADGVLKQVAENGEVQGVSYGTPMGRDRDFYRHVPIQPTAYGQGLTFLMLTELLHEAEEGSEEGQERQKLSNS